MNQQKKLDSVVDDFILSLSPDQSKQLNMLILNHQIVESWPWYEMVISRYLQADESIELVEDIDRLFPGESALKCIESSMDLPVFEAHIVLRMAQNILSSSGSSQ
jgi:hypothetical protein